MEKSTTSITKLAILLTFTSLAGCSSLSMPHFGSSVSPAIKMDPSTTQWTGNSIAIWDQLHKKSSADLIAMQTQTTDPDQKAWIELTLISKKDSANTSALVHDLMAWRQQNPSHPGNRLFPDDAALNQLLTAPAPNHLAILLPESNAYRHSGKVVREGFLQAYYANRAKPQSQTVKFYDTAQSLNLSLLYQQTYAEGADFVVGPLLKPDVQAVINGGGIDHPTIALNYTENGSLPNNLFEFGLLPEDEAVQIADKARDAGLSRAIIIAPDSALGQRMVDAVQSRWKQLGGSVQETWRYQPNSNFNEDVAKLLHVDISADKKLMTKDNSKETLSKQRRQDFNVIFIFASPQQGRVIVPLLKYYYAGDVPVYATSSIYAGKANPAKDADLNGVTVCDIPSNIRGNRQGGSKDRLYAVGQDAYTLSQVLPRMIAMPDFPLYGKTGALTLGHNRQIHRRLPCATMVNGQL